MTDTELVLDLWTSVAAIRRVRDCVLMPQSGIAAFLTELLARGEQG